MEINGRIKEIRTSLGLTQAEFGNHIGLKQNTVGQIENAQRGVTDRTILLICEKYSVREDWLRNGTGEMFLETGSTIVSQLSSEYGLDAFEKAMINGFLKMKPEQRAMLKEWVKSAMCEVFDNEQAYKEFGEEYDKGRALPFAARGGDTSGLAEAAERFNSTFPAAENKDGM